MSLKERQWRQAPMAPFIVARVGWVALDDSEEPALEMAASSWMGWALLPPADWRDALRGWKALREEIGAIEEPEPMWPRRPAGIGAPELESEESVHRDLSSPRVALLDATLCRRGPIPREWSSAWHAEGAESLLRARQSRVEAALREMGFGDIEPLGLRLDLSGDDYWLNAALAAAPALMAREQAREIDRGLAPGAPSPPPRSL